ncbi:hypothetical protein ACH6EH_06950 [Paenibacillus sp. JSM ZJ436]|uniref:hypothetical protein n=1 Tax=Paenibacillus sp. JSM ZJ436 TaxID=3376190 RepID=UPI0037A5123F
MLDAIIYVTMSMIEGFILFFFAFGLFRIDLRDYWKEVGIAVTTISLGTFFYSTSDALSPISPLLNMSAMILFLIILFKLPMLHSFYVVATTFIVVLVMQGITVASVGNIANLTLAEIKNNDHLRYSFQLTTDLLILCLSVFLRKKKLWYTFIPYGKQKVKLTISNALLLMTSAFGIAIASTALNMNNFIIGTIFWSSFAALIIYIGIRKEASGND